MTTSSSVAPVALWRPIAVSVCAVLLLAFVGATLWEQDWKWGLPTPRPAHLNQPPIGSRLELPDTVSARWAPAAGRPLFLHFFNPDCPCSRFNQDHVRDLIRANRTRVTIVAVIEPEGGTVSPRAVADAERDLGVPVLLDADGSLAKRMGVYSSPQAVLVKADGALYYRGNYNLARYCTDERTEFARIAIEHLLMGAPKYDAPVQARIAYGCPLPSTLARLAQGAE
jgi:hypothetical protein